MYKIPANSLFMGKNLVYVPECHSTNTLASALCQKSPVAEGTVVITDHQTKGRGQRGNEWVSGAGVNLTFSVVLKPSLPVAEQFSLTIVTSLALHDLLAHFGLPGVKIKWPNDILVNEKKICGILIENSVSGNKIQHSIAGIGLNVNQESFPVATATSLALQAGKKYVLEDVLHELLGKLEARYLMLRAGRKDVLKADYLKVLYRRGERHQFITDEGTQEGMIMDVTDSGQLVVEMLSGRRMYNLKEISFADK